VLPPPTPHERRLRRRRRLLAVLAAVALVAVGAAGAGLLAGLGGPSASGDAERDGTEGSEEGPGGPDAPDAPRAPTPLERPELDGLGPADLALARLLIEIDDSELVMLTYDVELTAAFEPFAGEAPDLDAVLDEVSAAAGRGEQGLAAIARRISDALAEPDAEAVRAAYAPHLEAWRVHMARVAATPDVLLTDGATAADTAEINITADIFRRALEDVLAGDVDPEVAAFAEAILDRGFRGYEVDAEVALPAPSPRASARSAAISATSARTRSSS